MKTLGLIGGMSWESTAIYYRLLNEGARLRQGGLHSASLLLLSVDFAEIAALQAQGNWEALTSVMITAAHQLRRGGAEGLVICTNTMHKMAQQIEDAVQLPIIHIVDATAAAILRTTSRKPLLLATRYTMKQEFYRARLLNRHGVRAVVPGEAERAEIHRIIYDELCLGIVSEPSKQTFLEIIGRARRMGSDGVVLGCTEITMLLGAGDVDIPVFDTTAIHADAALDFALH
ncbi:aspartate racemase [Rhodoligotrophos appendicifer]|uniref:aspartate/glutamate racemase family protein n=1 Tax=Rhodoligotrophos appendicifer TaxID=987056 RepID=UPI0011849B93|nr:aspartate/glutamate racemase family protein [Rhodoligotrophos appendicifer]